MQLQPAQTINSSEKNTKTHKTHSWAIFLMDWREKKTKPQPEINSSEKTQKHTKHMPEPFFLWIGKNTKTHKTHGSFNLV